MMRAVADAPDTQARSQHRRRGHGLPGSRVPPAQAAHARARRQPLVRERRVPDRPSDATLVRSAVGRRLRRRRLLSAMRHLSPEVLLTIRCRSIVCRWRVAQRQSAGPKDPVDAGSTPAAPPSARRNASERRLRRVRAGARPNAWSAGTCDVPAGTSPNAGSRTLRACDV